MEDPVDKAERSAFVRHFPVPPRVYDNIMSFLGVKDLRSVREVCRHWAQASMAPLLKKGYVRFNSEKRVEEYTAYFQKSPADYYNKFIFKGPMPLSASILTFFGIFGPYMKYLKLEQCLWAGGKLHAIIPITPHLESFTLIGRVSSVDRIYPQATTCLAELESANNVNWPYLTSLSLDLGGYVEEVMHWNYRSDASLVANFLYQILLAVPNLRVIDCPTSDPMFLRTVLNIMLIRQEVRLPRLSVINIRPTLGNFELKLLEIKQFPLVSFALDVRPEVSLHVLHNLLSSLGSSLKQLKLRFLQKDMITAQHFPSSSSLVKLRELVLIKFNGSLLFIHDLVALEEIFLDDINLRTVLRGPRGESLLMPVGFVYENQIGGVRFTRSRSLVGRIH